MALARSATPAGLWHYVFRGLCSLVFMFLAAPVLVVIPLSFNVEPYFSYPMPGFSLRWYQEVLGSEDWRRAAWNSVLIAGLATALSMCLGTLAALGLSRARFRL